MPHLTRSALTVLKSSWVPIGSDVPAVVRYMTLSQ